MKKLLSGNQAIARGAWEAGVSVSAGYPGTPSTEILESLAPYPGQYAEWCPNEKVAMDVAVGAAYTGKRAMAVMKHVGVNVAADALFYVAMTGIEGGLVLVVADDPGMHSSQGEQDTRRYAKFARIPCLEPSDSQECKDIMAQAFELSESFDTPVLVRVSTRISHSYGVVELGDPPKHPETPPPPPDYEINPRKYVMVPAFARARHPVMEQRVADLADYASYASVNRIEWGSSDLGIITNGVAYQYVKEVFPEASILRLGMTYPVPQLLVRELDDKVERLLVIEELDPVIEEEIRLLGIACEGKSIFPAVGEFSPELLRQCATEAGINVSGDIPAARPQADVSLPSRPPVLCPGCPHRGIYSMLNKLGVVVNGDIGCYTLGFLPPLSAVHTTGCMGASIGVAHGVAKAGISQKNVAVIGDSTFFHTGIPALLNVAYNQSNTVVVILDNRTTAMTGHQEHPGTGRTLQGQPTHEAHIPTIVHALGIPKVYEVDPYDLAGTEQALSDALEYDGPAVVIAERPCALLPEIRRQYSALTIDPEVCIGCGRCLNLGCPALSRSETAMTKRGKPVAQIDPLLCTGCEVCAQVCPVQAISRRKTPWICDQTPAGGNA